jgi:hypothetical protein
MSKTYFNIKFKNGEKFERVLLHFQNNMCGEDITELNFQNFINEKEEPIFDTAYFDIIQDNQIIRRINAFEFIKQLQEYTINI